MASTDPRESRSPRSRTRRASRCRRSPRCSTAAPTCRRPPAAASRCCSPSTATCAARPGSSAPRLIELVFHELEAAWSMEIIRGVENIATEHGMSVVLTESGSRHAPAAGLDRGRAAPPPGRRRARVLRPARRVPRDAALARHPVRDHRPGGRPVARRAVGRLGELVGRAHGHPAPHRARPHADRGDHRPRRHDVLARPHRRLPLGDELGRASRSTPTGSASATSTPRAASEHGRELLDARRPADGDLRRQRPAGARRARGGARARTCGCPTTSRSSATTTSRSPSG